MPPVVSGEKAREMMVNDVRPGNRPAHKGGVFADIGVFDPMDDSGSKIGSQDNCDSLERIQNHFHAPLLTQAVRTALIDKITPALFLSMPFALQAGLLRELELRRA